MKGYLLDANVLIALAWPNHTEHERVQEWFALERGHGWATCLVTQLAFIRVSSSVLVPHHVSPSVAQRYLGEITSLPDHSYWSEPPAGYAHAAFARTMPNTLTHSSVTDGYLATLALIHGGKLATLDRQLAKSFEGAVLV
jgi:toxin-antitoxin system PIN domain toxin